MGLSEFSACGSEIKSLISGLPCVTLKKPEIETSSPKKPQGRTPGDTLSLTLSKALDRTYKTNTKIIFVLKLVHFTGDFYSSFLTPPPARAAGQFLLAPHPGGSSLRHQSPYGLYRATLCRVPCRSLPQPGLYPRRTPSRYGPTFSSWHSFLC